MGTVIEGGVLVFSVFFFKPPPTRIVTTQALVNNPEDRRGRHPGQVDSCKLATAAKAGLPWAQGER